MVVPILKTKKTSIVTKIPASATPGSFVSTDNVNQQTILDTVFRVHPPKNFKIAFFADTNIGPNAEAALRLVKNEDADAVVHPGDLNDNGDARLAHFYFKDIDGKVRDEFFVRSNN